MKYWIVMLVVLLAGCGNGESSGRNQDNERNQHPGRQTYDRWCVSCHLAGVSGAPKLAQPEDWVARLPKGRAVLLESVIKGIAPTMPERGLCRSCSDEELSEALDYMLSTLPKNKINP